MGDDIENSIKRFENDKERLENVVNVLKPMRTFRKRCEACRERFLREANYVHSSKKVAKQSIVTPDQARVY